MEIVALPKLQYHSQNPGLQNLRTAITSFLASRQQHKKHAFTLSLSLCIPLWTSPTLSYRKRRWTFLSPNELVSKLSEQQSQVNADTNNTDANKIQGFVISSNKQRADQFLRRNKESLTTTANINASPLSIKWFPGMNGNDQKVMDKYAQLTGFAALNATRFPVSEGEKNKKNLQGGRYATPYHTGCFMSQVEIYLLRGPRMRDNDNNNYIGRRAILPILMPI
jgi:hypothetical protein